MPRKAIDYSKTIIYKLCCNDTSITDIYVGHTTNWTKRKQGHKNNCNNPNNEKYNIYVYQFIRNHGGWTNWSMIELEKICCVDEPEACKHERRHLELLRATLNKVIPTRSHQEYYETNKDVIKEHHKQYYEENKEVIAEKTKQYREKNKEKAKEYYETNKEQIKEYNKEYYEKNKNIINEKRRLNRLKKKNAMSSSIPLLPCQTQEHVEIL
jgi:hypothetical protein